MLLAPAGNLEAAKRAFQAGAGAVKSDYGVDSWHRN